MNIKVLEACLLQHFYIHSTKIDETKIIIIIIYHSIQWILLTATPSPTTRGTTGPTRISS